MPHLVVKASFVESFLLFAIVFTLQLVKRIIGLAKENLQLNNPKLFAQWTVSPVHVQGQAGLVRTCTYDNEIT